MLVISFDPAREIKNYEMRKISRFLPIILYPLYLFALLEGTARLSYMIPAISYRLEADEDASWRRRWISNQGRNVAAQYAYVFDIFDPTKGWITKPNLRDMEVFEGKVLNTNSRSFRGKGEFTFGEHPGSTRVLILGDSFTFGEDVSDNETYSYYLQEMMPTADIINMGVHGYGHDQMLILLKEEGVRYKPDIVIVGFLPVDMSRNILQFRDYAKPKFVLKNDKLALTGSPVPRPEEILDRDWARPRLYDVCLSFRHKILARSGLYEKQMKEVTRHLLQEMAVTIYKAGAVPIFVYLPEVDEISNQSALTEGERFLFSCCKDNGMIHCFSLRPYFANKLMQGVDFRTPNQDHWGPIAHRTAAEAIYEYLAAQGYLQKEVAY